MFNNKDQDLCNDDNDPQLVQGCADGDLVSQKKLYEQFSKKMMGVCLRYADNYEDAQDILQEGFIKIFKNIHSFKGTGSLEGWIRRIITNTALAVYRTSNPLRLSKGIEELELIPASDSNIIGSISVKDLLNIIRKLPAGYRIVFNLYAIEGYSHKEIASQLNITESTSKSQYSRARSHLQKIIQSEEAS